MESTEGFRATEQGGQKPATDPPAAACIPIKPLASASAFWDGRKRGDPLGEPVAFPQGLPAGAEEQRQFLTEQCIASFHLCLSRFPQHYKSLYRLAFLYTYSKTHRVSRRPSRAAGERAWLFFPGQAGRPRQIEHPDSSAWEGWARRAGRSRASTESGPACQGRGLGLRL